MFFLDSWTDFIRPNDEFVLTALGMMGNWIIGRIVLRQVQYLPTYMNRPDGTWKWIIFIVGLFG